MRLESQNLKPDKETPPSKWKTTNSTKGRTESQRHGNNKAYDNFLNKHFNIFKLIKEENASIAKRGVGVGYGTKIGRCKIKTTWYDKIINARNEYIYIYIHTYIHTYIKCFSDGSDSKESAYNAGDLHLITGSERSPPPALWRPLFVEPNRQEVSWEGEVWFTKSQPKKWGREIITGYPCRHVR